MHGGFSKGRAGSPGPAEQGAWTREGGSWGPEPNPELHTGIFSKKSSVYCHEINHDIMKVKGTY